MTPNQMKIQMLQCRLMNKQDRMIQMTMIQMTSTYEVAHQTGTNQSTEMLARGAAADMLMASTRIAHAKNRIITNRERLNVTH